MIVALSIITALSLSALVAAFYRLLWLEAIIKALRLDVRWYQAEAMRLASDASSVRRELAAQLDNMDIL